MKLPPHVVELLDGSESPESVIKSLGLALEESALGAEKCLQYETEFDRDVRYQFAVVCFEKALAAAAIRAMEAWLVINENGAPHGPDRIAWNDARAEYRAVRDCGKKEVLP